MSLYRYIKQCRGAKEWNGENQYDLKSKNAISIEK